MLSTRWRCAWFTETMAQRDRLLNIVDKHRIHAMYKKTDKSGKYNCKCDNDDSVDAKRVNNRSMITCELDQSIHGHVVGFRGNQSCLLVYIFLSCLKTYENERKITMKLLLDTANGWPPRPSKRYNCRCKQIWWHHTTDNAHHCFTHIIDVFEQKQPHHLHIRSSHQSRVFYLTPPTQFFSRS